ncbi:MAG: hypothetical protein ACREUV_06735 [Burkholderiales bacterium]
MDIISRDLRRKAEVPGHGQKGQADTDYSPACKPIRIKQKPENSFCFLAAVKIFLKKPNIIHAT